MITRQTIPSFIDTAFSRALARYRLAAPGLIVAALVFAVSIRQLGLHEVWLMVLAVPCYLVAVTLTFRRLEQVGRTGWWVLLMIANLSFGPDVFGITPAILINLVPVALAWPAPKPAAAADPA